MPQATVDPGITFDSVFVSYLVIGAYKLIM